MICKNCGKEFEGKFCPECGTQVGFNLICPICGKERNDGGKFCSECGFDFINEATVRQTRQPLRLDFSKIYRYIIAGGMILLGIITLLCMLSPVMTMDGLLGDELLGSGFEAIKGGEELEYEKVVSDICIGILIVSIWSILYGFAQLVLLLKKKREERYEVFFWMADCLIAVLLLVFSSVLLACVKYETSELAEIKLGSGFVLIMAISIIAILVLWLRIYYQHRLLLKNKNLKNEDDDVIIPKGVTSISQRAFNNCIGLTKVVIPDTVTSIGEYAFANCKGLREIFLPSSVKDIGFSAFYGCGELTIYCQASSAPSGWNGSWDYSDSKLNVVWGYKGNI